MHNIFNTIIFHLVSFSSDAHSLMKYYCIEKNMHILNTDHHIHRAMCVCMRQIRYSNAIISLNIGITAYNNIISLDVIIIIALIDVFT